MTKPVFHLAPDIQLVLASTSPRRAELLGSLGIDFTVADPGKCETPPRADQPPDLYARETAVAKGKSVLKKSPSGSIILAADTIVCLRAEILGKPATPQDALAMLRKLNGRSHTVLTAFYLAIPFPDKALMPALLAAFPENVSLGNARGHMEIMSHAESQVTFASWPDAALSAYAQSGEGNDKAGAYAIQGIGSFLVSSLSGSWTNVVGLPLTPITSILLAAGLILPES